MRRILLPFGLLAALVSACGGDGTGIESTDKLPRKGQAAAPPFAPFGEPAVSDPIEPVSDKRGSNGKPTPDPFGLGGASIPDESFGGGGSLPTGDQPPVDAGVRQDAATSG